MLYSFKYFCKSGITFNLYFLYALELPCYILLNIFHIFSLVQCKTKPKKVFVSFRFSSFVQQGIFFHFTNLHSKSIMFLCFSSAQFQKGSTLQCI